MAECLQLRVQNFKSLRDVQLELRPGLNVLIGPNGSGKTNFLSALKFTRDFMLHGAARAVAFAGGPRSVYSRDADRVLIHLKMPYGSRQIRRQPIPVYMLWSFAISQSTGEIPTVVSEAVRLIAVTGGTEEELFALTRDTHSGRIEKSLPKDETIRAIFAGWPSTRDRKRDRKDQIDVNKYIDNVSRALTGDTDHSMLPALAQLDTKLSHLSGLFHALNEYNILPDIARAPSEPSPYAYMRPDGAGMSEVVHALTEGLFYKLEDSRRLDVDLFTLRLTGFLPQFWYPVPEFLLWSHRREPRAIETALDNIKEQLVAAVRPIDGLTTQLDHNTGKRFAVFTAGGKRFLPSEVSDGTIKWLCILISLFVTKSSVYLLEEPENFLHPWMQQRLVSTMRQQAAASQTMFFLTSHSTTVLNSVTPDEILIVTPAHNGTEIDRIRDREEIEHVLANSQFGLGDLWVSGAIDGVPH